MLELLQNAHEGDKEAFDLLVRKNTGLVWSIVKRYRNGEYDAEELFQIGCIGLMKAIERFDFSYEVKFSTYAVPLIAGEIRRFLRDDGMLKVSRTIKENAQKIQKEAERWRNRYAREATVKELADCLKMSVEDIVLALSASLPVDSLSRAVPQTSGKEVLLQEQIRDEKNEIEIKTDHIFLQQLLSVLSKEERRLICLRYFQAKTQAEVAGQMGMTQVQVSRMEKKLLQKMRQAV